MCEPDWALVLHIASLGSPGFAAGICAWLPLPNLTFGHVFVQKGALF